MLASKLLEEIQALIVKHGDKHVILQGDQEGNYYSELSGIERTFYEDDSTADCREEAGEDAQEVFVVYP